MGTYGGASADGASTGVSTMTLVRARVRWRRLRTHPTGRTLLEPFQRLERAGNARQPRRHSYVMCGFGGAPAAGNNVHSRTLKRSSLYGYG